MGKYNPIGIFDSGVGGLTVVKSLLKELPYENFIYFGDTAHVPYGNKTPSELFSYAHNIVKFLMANNVKAIIVACGTHSSITLPVISTEYSLPILGVVNPGATMATNHSKNNKIGVLATQATVKSLAYTKAIKSINKNYEVYEVFCPEFVTLVEAGKLNGEATEIAVAKYVEPLKALGIDTLILGCTHYPFLEGLIGLYAGGDIKLINPSYTTVTVLKKILAQKGLLNDEELTPQREFYVSGDDTSFFKVGNLLLGNIIEKVTKVNL